MSNKTHMSYRKLGLAPLEIFKKTFFILLFPAIFLLLPKTVLAAGNLIINEIMYNLPLPGADDKHEWIELYNAGQTDINLDGWKFNDGANHVLKPPPENGSRGSLIIPAGSYLILSGNASTTISDMPNYNGSMIDTVMSLSNTAATLKILDKDNAEIAAASYNKEMGADGNGKTLQWNGATFVEGAADGGTPGAANIFSAQFTASPNPSPASSSATPSPSASPIPPISQISPIAPSTPTPAPTAPAYQFSNDIFLNEFMPDPGKNEKEWIELYNAGAEPVNLTGWQIDDAQNSRQPKLIPENTILEPKEFLTIYFDSGLFNNDSDEVRLLWPDNQILHSVAYKNAPAGSSSARFNNQWFWTNQPTPGAANKKFVENAATQAIPPVNLVAAETADVKNQLVAAARQETISEPTKETAAQKSSPQQSQNSILSPVNGNQPPVSTNTNSPAQDDTDINTKAAIPGPPSSNLKTYLLLILLLFGSGAAGLGLIYLKRKASRQTDNNKKNI